MAATVQTRAEGAKPTGRGGLRRVRKWLSFRNASALWIFVFLFVLYSIWVPDTFLTSTTWRTLLDSQAVPAIVAVALVIPLAAGAFDLAVGAEVGFAAVLVAWLMAKAGIPAIPAVVLAILCGCVIGLMSGLLVIKARIDSFIATLGVSSILAAAITWVSGGEQILGLSHKFLNVGGTQVFGGVSLIFVIMIVISIVVFYVLECTTIGRRVYATGGGLEAARLSGVRTSLVIVSSLVACGGIAAIAGVLLTSQLEVGDPTVGPDYLLPAFTAAFLGSTQFRGGRFNVWGTVAAVFVLAVGVKGVQLAGAPVWVPDLFNGVALIIAVGLAKYQGKSQRLSAIRRIARRPGARREDANRRTESTYDNSKV